MNKVGQLNPKRVRVWAWEQTLRLRRRAKRRLDDAKEMPICESRTTRLRQAEQDDEAANRFIKIVQILNDFPGCTSTTAEQDLLRISQGGRL